MNNVEAKELLQAKALGCLDPEDDALVTKLMKEDENFPWQELGHYQNLVAFLPTILDIEVPEPEVKDNVARKLYELGEKIKAKKEEEVKQSIVAEETKLKKIEEDGFILEEEPLEETGMPEATEEPVKAGKTNTGISFKDHRAQQQDALNEGKRAIREPLEKKRKAEPEKRKISRQQKKEYEPVYDESYLSEFSSGSRISERSKNKTRFIVTVILFAVTLLALIFVYFILSSDIRENRDKIDRLEKLIGTEFILENSSIHKSFYT